MKYPSFAPRTELLSCYCFGGEFAKFDGNTYAPPLLGSLNDHYHYGLVVSCTKKSKEWVFNAQFYRLFLTNNAKSAHIYSASGPLSKQAAQELQYDFKQVLGCMPDSVAALPVPFFGLHENFYRTDNRSILYWKNN